MKLIYENFSEIAEAFKDGEAWTHTLSPHGSNECISWQQGIREFARWLDTAGVKLIQNPEIYDNLWEDLDTSRCFCESCEKLFMKHKCDHIGKGKK